MWLLLLAPVTVLPQKPGRPPDTIIRINVNLVQIDAVATDSQGHSVPGLKAAAIRRTIVFVVDDLLRSFPRLASSPNASFPTPALWLAAHETVLGLDPEMETKRPGA
ncbi:hypothetical protein SBA3_670052 [Candidatus Sulfopaludibacter sp. SbA3]|nr:hypothetical protein SBA3_670052 [Candidatus Sulfopaludibacter sp. SbA3]